MIEQITLKRETHKFDTPKELHDFLNGVDDADRYIKVERYYSASYLTLTETLESFIDRVLSVANTLSDVICIQYLDDKHTAFIIHRLIK